MMLVVENNYSHLVDYPKERVIEITEVELYLYQAMHALSHMSVYAGLPGAEANINKQAAAIDVYISEMMDSLESYTGLINKDKEFTSADKSARIAVINDIRTLISDYRNQVIIPITQANQAGRREEVMAISGNTEHISDELVKIIDGLRESALSSAAEISESTSAFALFALVVLIVLSVITIAVGVIFGIIIAKSVVSSLKNSVGKMGMAVNTVTQSSRELNNASRIIAEGAQEQAASIEETSATMNETASMIKLTKENTQQAARLSSESEKSTMNSLQNVEDLVSVMNRLNESSSQIEKIADTIKSLASQTNILALNASVESARAGEAGKAFAVVAEEVRSLATASSNAARSTADIIKENIELALQGVENSKTVSSSLNGVHEDVRQINMLLSEISTASEEQSRGVDQIAIAMSQMEQATQSSAATSEESSAAANELLIISEDLAEVTNSLNAMI